MLKGQRILLITLLSLIKAVVRVSIVSGYFLNLIRDEIIAINVDKNIGHIPAVLVVAVPYFSLFVKCGIIELF